MKNDLPRHDWPTLITVFLALGGIGMMVIFSLLIGFGFHTIIGKIALYECYVLQLINLVVMAFRRQHLRQKYNSPEPSKKMKRFYLTGLCIWLVGSVLLLVSLACGIFWKSASTDWTLYLSVSGAILTLLGWIALLAAFHRRRQAALLAQETSS